MSYYIGIDGGGTKTACAVGDESQLLATASSGPSNIVRVGDAQARESLLLCVRQACAAAGVTPADVLRTCVGGAGAARPEVAGKVREILAQLLPNLVLVVGDMEIALEAAFGSGPGVIVIAGTGSIAFGRNAQGDTARAGGWGFAIGDEGSAHWIGKQAVAAVLRAADKNRNNESSRLGEALMKTWNVPSLLDLARTANAFSPPDFAALLPAVVEAQDELARDVLINGGRELARIPATVIRKLFPPDARTVPVAMTGGVFRHASLVREVFYNELRAFDDRVALNEKVVEPVEGALQIARRGHL